MKCPYCKSLETRVIETRTTGEGLVIRRRRECPLCQKRFTTFERIEEVFPLVVKRDGRREAYSREKVLEGLRKALHKRPVSADVVEEMVEKIERYILSLGLSEVPSIVIGEKIMELLKETDEVAYVRFASVYRRFKDADDFLKEVEDLKRKRID